VSPLAIVAIVLGVLIVVFFVGGLIVVRRRAEAHAEEFTQHIAAADRALEAARAQDRGWDRVRLEEAARVALKRERPDFGYDALHLVQVEDRPGTEEDRARMRAVGADGEANVVLVRQGDSWVSESVS
jgi:hypothetical protein